MGAWGVGPFEDDAALDWVGELAEADRDERPGIVKETLGRSLHAEGYLEQPDAAEAIAAAAVVAFVRGDVEDAPSELEPVLRSGGLEIDSELPALARRALQRVTAGSSEWRELWEESGELASALEMINSLDQLLSA